jgi:hypothetical protein
MQWFCEGGDMWGKIHLERAGLASLQTAIYTLEALLLLGHVTSKLIIAAGRRARHEYMHEW